MCTAAGYKAKDFYFGRTLDNDFSYGEEIVIIPRSFPLHFRAEKEMLQHYAIIGMAHIADGYPLFYDAVNEKGLAIAGLNFVGNACYQSKQAGKINIAQFELIPWLLAQCGNVKSAVDLLKEINITDAAFSEALPPAQLHWLLADKEQCVTIEAVREGLMIYDNPVGVLTNNPPFPEQLSRMNDFMQLSPLPPGNSFSDKLHFSPYSRGMGALGLPGDLSSASRFVRAAFVRLNSVSADDELSGVSQFFHILGSVEQQRGCCILGNGGLELTLYTSCCNADRGIYYYKTYDNHGITAVNMHKENLDAEKLIHYPLCQAMEIKMQN